jgi:soluble lytic murein transglycosylase-like protein
MPVPAWAYKLDWDLIRKKASEHGLDPNLVAAFIMQESSGNPWKFRYEPLVASSQRYMVQARDFASNLNISPETEVVLQSSSYGLLQIMGFVCRELGFKGMLTELLQAELNLEYGCQKIKSCLQRWHTEADAVSAYNQGSPRKMPSGMFENQKYVDQLYRYLNELRKL